MSKDPESGSSLRACSSSDMVVSPSKMSSICSLKFEKTDFFKKIIHDDFRQIFDWKDV